MTKKNLATRFLPSDYEQRFEKQELYQAPYMIWGSLALASTFFLIFLYRLSALFISSMIAFFITFVLLIISLVMMKKGKPVLSGYFVTFALVESTYVEAFLEPAEIAPQLLFRLATYVLAMLVFNQLATLKRRQIFLMGISGIIAFLIGSFRYFKQWPDQHALLYAIMAVGLLAIIVCTTIILLLFIMTRKISDRAYAESEKSRAALSVVTGLLGEVQESLAIGERLKTQTDRAGTEVAKLEELYKYLNTESENLTGSAASISGSSANVQKQAEGMKTSVQEENAAITQTSAALTEISSNITNISGIANARRASLDSVVKTTQKQTEQIKTILDKVESVKNSSAKIGGFVNTVNDIASQTSLLAMNASIEAAHAGEAGKGFAVVAQEIRKLSSETTKNADAISEALKENNSLVQETTEAVTVFADFTKKSAGEIKTTTDSIEEILAGIAEMDTGTREVMEAMQNLVDECHKTGDLVAEVVTNMNSQGKSIGKVTEFSSALKNRVQAIESLVASIRSVTEAIQTESRNTNAASVKISAALKQYHSGQK